MPATGKHDPARSKRQSVGPMPDRSARTIQRFAVGEAVTWLPRNQATARPCRRGDRPECKRAREKFEGRRHRQRNEQEHCAASAARPKTKMGRERGTEYANKQKLDSCSRTEYRAGNLARRKLDDQADPPCWLIQKWGRGLSPALFPASSSCKVRLRAKSNGKSAPDDWWAAVST